MMNNLTHYLAWCLGLAKPWTYYSEAECGLLEKYARNKKRLVEIGCWQGVNTARLRKAMPPEAVFYAVDPYPKGRFGVNFAQWIAAKEVEKIKNGTLIWVQKTDLEAAAWLKSQKAALLDFIFSDSCNSYEGFKACWEAWSPLLASQGIYVLANSCSDSSGKIENAGSVRFTRDVIMKDERYEFLESAGSFTIMRKR